MLFLILLPLLLLPKHIYCEFQNNLMKRLTDMERQTVNYNLYISVRYLLCILLGGWNIDRIYKTRILSNDALYNKNKIYCMLC